VVGAAAIQVLVACGDASYLGSAGDRPLEAPLVTFLARR
jgi:hypothetical protein